MSPQKSSVVSNLNKENSSNFGKYDQARTREEHEENKDNWTKVKIN